MLVLAGDGGHTGYAYALAQTLHEKYFYLFMFLKEMLIKF